MTTSATGRKLTDACNGVTVTFNCPSFQTPGDLKVYLLDSATAANSDGTLLTPGTDYTIGGGDSASGLATVTTLAVQPLGKFIRRWRSTSRRQDVEIVAGQGVPAATQEAALDRLSLVDEEHDDDFARAVSTPPGEAGQVLPSRPDLIGKFLAGDVDGNLVASAGTGADAGLRTDLAAATGFTLIKYKSSKANTYARSAASLAQIGPIEDANVFHFIDPALDASILDGSNALDLAAYVQNALNSGGPLALLPKGFFKWSSISVPADVHLLGRGRLTTVVPADNVSNLIVVDGGGALVTDFQIVPPAQRTGGCYLKVNQPELYVARLTMNGGFKLIDIGGAVNQVRVEQLSLRDNLNNGASELILINTTGGDLVFEGIFADNNPATMPLAGFRVRSCADLTINDSNIIHCGSDLLVDPPAGKVVASLFSSNTFYDTATKGVSLKPAGGAIVRAHFHNAWASSHTSHGFEIDSTGGPIDGVYLVDPQVNLNGGDGIHLVGSVNVRIAGGQGGQNVGAGFYASATASKFALRGFVSGATDALAGNAYGIKIDAGAADFSVTDPVCSGNTVADVVGLTPTLASGGVLTLPPAGAAFIISGATDIGTIAGGVDGREVTLHFLGALTVHTATGTVNSVRLAGGANFAVVAGSTLRLRHNGTQWYETARAA